MLVDMTQGFTRTVVPGDVDAVLVPFDKTRTGSLQVLGGRSVTSIGGRQVWSDRGRLIANHYVDFSHSIFIEGQHVIMRRPGDAYVAGGTSRHRSQLDNFPDVYLQNIRVEGVQGTYEGLHADVFQLDCATNNLRIDMMTGETTYQGLFLRPVTPVQGSIDIRRSNFKLRLDPKQPRDTRLIYFAMNTDELMASHHPIYLTDVWCQIPDGADPMRCCSPSSDAVLAEDEISRFVWWPNLGSRISDLNGKPGRIRIGAPPAGDFVPQQAVGLDYHSPGYFGGSAA